MDYLATKPAKLRKQVIEAPLNPGCYLYRNKSGQVLYVGKAKVLRKRVRSYFQNYPRLDPKIQIMLDKAVSVDYVIADSEIEALILENNLIKKYRPKYNTMMVDDKNYIWLRIDRRKGSPIPKKLAGKKVAPGVDFPTLNIVRNQLDDGAHYFGPYPDTRPLRRTINRLRKLFPFCTDGKKFTRSDSRLLKVKPNQKKPCFHYHLGLCNGVCAGLETKTEYNKRIEDLKKFFRGEKQAIAERLERNMRQAAKDRNFEKAAILRDRLRDIKYVTQHISLDQDLDEVEIMEAKQKQRKSALLDLIEYLQFPNLHNHANFRIECYDISNIQGTNATGAMTVMIDGKAEPRLYRKFRIRMKNEPNDFAMMQETLFRRFYSYLVHHKLAQQLTMHDAEGVEINPKKYYTTAAKQFDESLNMVPDLIVIDGGKGQLSSAFRIMKQFNLDIPMIGLAKREEEVYVVKQQRIDSDYLADSGVNLVELEFEKIHLPRNTEASYLLQNIRDEAHRFGINYHRKLRLKQTLQI